MCSQPAGWKSTSFRRQVSGLLPHIERHMLSCCKPPKPFPLTAPRPDLQPGGGGGCCQRRGSQPFVHPRCFGWTPFCNLFTGLVKSPHSLPQLMSTTTTTTHRTHEDPWALSGLLWGSYPPFPSVGDRHRATLAPVRTVGCGSHLPRNQKVSGPLGMRNPRTPRPNARIVGLRKLRGPRGCPTPILP